MRANGLEEQTSEMEEGYKYGKTEVDMKVTGETIELMEEAD